MRTEKQIKHKIALLTKALDELNTVHFEFRTPRWRRSYHNSMSLLFGLLWVSGDSWPCESSVAEAKRVARSCR